MGVPIKILIACGSGIATSAHAGEVVKNFIKEEGFNATVSKCSMQEFKSYLDSVDVVLFTNNYRGELDKPHMMIFHLISGINQDKVLADLRQLLKEVEAKKKAQQE